MSSSNPAGSSVDSVLDAAESVFLDQGFDGVSLDGVAEKSGIPHQELATLYPSELDLLVAVMNREFMTMYRGIVSDVERDPRGGLLSKIYTYTLTQVYERPVARTLFMIDRSALHSLMRHQHASMYVPSVEIRRELIEDLQKVGMVRPDCDPGVVSEAITVISGGLAITAPHSRLDEIVQSLMEMFGRKYDAEVEDTSPGKKVFYAWASRLDSGSPRKQG